MAYTILFFSMFLSLTSQALYFPDDTNNDAKRRIDNTLSQLNLSEKDLLLNALSSYELMVRRSKEEESAHRELWFRLGTISGGIWFIKTITLGESIKSGMRDIFQFVCLDTTFPAHTVGGVPFSEVSDLCVHLGQWLPDYMTWGLGIVAAGLIIGHMRYIFFRPGIYDEDISLTPYELRELRAKLVPCPELLGPFDAVFGAHIKSSDTELPI